MNDVISRLTCVLVRGYIHDTTIAALTIYINRHTLALALMMSRNLVRTGVKRVEITSYHVSRRSVATYGYTAGSSSIVFSLTATSYTSVLPVVDQSR